MILACDHYPAQRQGGLFGSLSQGEQLSATRVGAKSSAAGALPAGGSVMAGGPPSRLALRQRPATPGAEDRDHNDHHSVTRFVTGLHHTTPLSHN